MKKILIYIGYVFSMSCLTGAVMADNSKVIYGYVEKVILVEKKVMLSAKLDTGAKTASLSAIKIKDLHENGLHYLTFIVPTKRGNFQFKAEYVGRVNIKPRMGEYIKELTSFRPLKRPIVKMKVRLGNKEREILFNLTNRKRFNYPVLLGRDAIVAFDGLIDPAYAFILSKKR